MHPNVFMKLSSELQVICHLSKVQLRNFWTWIQMIFRIFCGNKGTVLPFPFWICCFCRFQSAPDFLRSWAITATCLASACDFSSAVGQLLTSNRLSLRLWTELVISLLRTCAGFFDWFGYVCRIHLEEYHEPVFLHFQQVYLVYCNFLCTHLKHWRLRERKSKKTWYISALSW